MSVPTVWLFMCLFRWVGSCQSAILSVPPRLTGPLDLLCETACPVWPACPDGCPASGLLLPCICVPHAASRADTPAAPLVASTVLRERLIICAPLPS